MCKWGNVETVAVKIPADLSCTRTARMKFVKIDKCIAPLVKALQEGKIDMRGSCCGHGIRWGNIHLQDGRMLLIVNADQYFNKKCRYLMKEMFKTIFQKTKNISNRWF